MFGEEFTHFTFKLFSRVQTKAHKRVFIWMTLCVSSYLQLLQNGALWMIRPSAVNLAVQKWTVPSTAAVTPAFTWAEPQTTASVRVSLTPFKTDFKPDIIHLIHCLILNHMLSYDVCLCVQMWTNVRCIRRSVEDLCALMSASTSRGLITVPVPPVTNCSLMEGAVRVRDKQMSLVFSLHCVFKQPQKPMLIYRKIVNKNNKE